MARRHPKLTPKVLKKGLDRIIGQPTGLSKNCNTAVMPAVQSIRSSEPHAAVPGRQNRLDRRVGQTLPDGTRGDGEVVKAVEAIQRGHPNVALAILKDLLDEIA